VTTLQLFLILAVALGVIGLGLRLARPPLTLAGFALAGFIAFGHLTARFGLDQLWFRAPTFYVACAVLVCGIAWWLRQPTPLALGKTSDLDLTM